MRAATGGSSPEQEGTARSRSHERNVRRRETGEVFEECNEYVTKSHMEELLKDMQNSLTASITTNIAAGVTQTVATQIATTITRYDERVSAHLERHDSELRDITNTQTEFQNKLDVMQANLADVQRRLGAAEQEERPSPSQLDLLDDDREPDLSIIRIRCQVQVTKANVKDALAGLLQDASVPEADVELSGRDVGKSFQWKFKGKVGPLRAKKALQIAANRGDWRTFYAASPSGPQQLFIDQDKSPKQDRLEMAGRRLKQAVVGLVSNSKKVDLRKKDATVFLDGKPVAKASTNAPEEFAVVFHHAVLQEHQLDAAAVRAAFNATINKGAADGTPWQL